jgi:hypothetical protein
MPTDELPLSVVSTGRTKIVIRMKKTTEEFSLFVV